MTKITTEQLDKLQFGRQLHQRGYEKMTQEQLEAAADAVAGLAAKYGYSAYISRDQQREIAAAVIWAYLRASEKKA